MSDKANDPLYYKKLASQYERQLLFLRKKHEFEKLEFEIQEFRLKRLLVLKQMAEIKVQEMPEDKPVNKPTKEK